MTEQKAKEMDELARHAQSLHKFLVKNGVSRPDACDILQNAFIKVFNRRETLPESLKERKAILFCEVNAHMMAYFTEQRRAVERAARAGELVVYLEQTRARDMSRVIEARQLLEMLFSEISPEQYQVFTDKVLDELTIREVAERLDMNVHTTKTHWFRALETLKSKLETIEHSGGRGLIMFLIIAGILGLAKNASAMVERLRRFFRAIRQANVLKLAGMATAGAIILSPPNSGASEHDASSLSHRMAMDALGAPTPLKIEPNAKMAGKDIVAAMPSVLDVPSRAVPSVPSRPRVSKQSTKRSVPPDYLITAAMTALRDGEPQRALVLLDQYVAADAAAGNSGMVKTLRAQTQAAIAARGK